MDYMTLSVAICSMANVSLFCLMHRILNKFNKRIENIEGEMDELRRTVSLLRQTRGAHRKKGS